MAKYEASRELVVKYISKTVPDEEILTLFREFGTLLSSRFLSKEDLDIKMAFITYQTLDQARKAQSRLNNYRMKGTQRILFCAFNNHDHRKDSTTKFTKGARDFSQPVFNRSASFTSSSNNNSKSPNDESKTICVLVTHIEEDTNFFWAQPVHQEQTTQAEDLAEQINNYCLSVLNGETELEETGDSKYLAAKFIDGKWYRVEILRKVDERALLQFIDYGNSSIEPVGELIPLPSDLCLSPICNKYSITDTQLNSFDLYAIYDKYIHITPLGQHPTNRNCTIVKVLFDESGEFTNPLQGNNSVSNTQTDIQSKPTNISTQHPSTQVSDSSDASFPQTAFTSPGIQPYPQQQQQQQQHSYPINTTTIYPSIETSSPMQQPQPNSLPSSTQLLSPQYSNVFTFPTVPVTPELPVQHIPQYQLVPQQLQQSSAFQAYQKNGGSEPITSPMGTVSTISKLDQKYPHPKYDPLHGPELLNRYRQELEDVDERMKATSGRVITLESQNSDLRNTIAFLESPESFQQQLRLMTTKMREFLSIKRHINSVQEDSSLKEIAQEVLSNRDRLSLSQMSEVMEVQSLQDQLADLTNLIRNNSDATEEPLGQLISQRDECRSKLITAIANQIETLDNFPLEERCDELKARFERLTQVPGYTSVSPKPIDLNVCLETYESVQSFDWKEMKPGQEDEEGLEGLCDRLQDSLKFYQKLLLLDPNEEIAEEEDDLVKLVHKIVQTADSDISILKNMEDVHIERRRTATCSLMEAIASELSRELDDVHSIQTSLLPQLLSEQEQLRAWESSTPSLTKLLTYKQEIKKVRTGLRHLRVDFQEAHDDCNLDNLSKIGNNIKSVLESFHQLLLNEHEELWYLAELADLHFSELPILYPDLGLQRQIQLGPIFYSGWEQDYFGELEEVEIFPEPSYLTIFNKESCLLREIKLTSPAQQFVLATNVSKLSSIQHKSILKCDAFFLSKSGFKAFLKHPSTEGTNLIDFIRTNHSSELSSKWLFSQILHGLSAIHESGLHCNVLTGKDIFISMDPLNVLITNIDFLSEASGQQTHLKHQFDLFNFCTLALSLLTTYEQDFLNQDPQNIENLIMNSGLDNQTTSFLYLSLNKNTSAKFLSGQDYFAELTECDTFLNRNYEGYDEGETKTEVENQDEKVSGNESEKLDENVDEVQSEGEKEIPEHENSSAEGDNEEVQVLMQT